MNRSFLSTRPKEPNEKHYKKILCFGSALLSMFMVFLSGCFHNDTKIEKCASYAGEVVSKCTRNSEYSSLIVESKTPNKKLCDSESEFYNLYGIFAESKVTFAPLYNADKSFDIHIKGVESSSLSILYGGGVRTEPYNGYYRHRVYPIDLMFEDEKYFYDHKYVVYISQRQADSILELDGIIPGADGYTEANYKSLLRKKITMIIDAVEYDYIIQNLYFNNNYYYDALTEVINDFVITSYYSYDVIVNHLQHVYFLKPFEYQNYYMMRYIKQLYSQKDFSLSIGQENLTNTIDDSRVLSFYYSDDFNPVISILLLVFSFILLAFSLFMFVFRNFSSRRNYLLLFISLFSPYFLLKIISFIVPHSPLFSFYSLKFNLFILLGCLLTIIIISYFKKHFSKFLKKRSEMYCEVNI